MPSILSEPSLQAGFPFVARTHLISQSCCNPCADPVTFVPSVRRLPCGDLDIHLHLSRSMEPDGILIPDERVRIQAIFDTGARTIRYGVTQTITPPEGATCLLGLHARLGLGPEWTDLIFPCMGEDDAGLSGLLLLADGQQPAPAAPVKQDLSNKPIEGLIYDLDKGSYTEREAATAELG